MKKYLILLAAIVLLTGCGNQGDNSKDMNGEQIADQNHNSQGTENEGQNAEEENQGFSFSAGDLKIYLNQEAAPFVKTLGNAMEQFEAPSCAFQGMDVFYVYPGFELSTYPLDGSHYVSTIDLIDDSVSTEEGIYIGSTLDDVVDKYGDNYGKSGDIYTYISGDTSLSFAIVNNVVENITYMALVGDQK
ncbi:MAG: hypothetical protein M0Q14_02200 [Tissierellaceae bacterium]|nr:hypothetical protein [Tissierellaceae bacterium]